jgi:hypothetical protein
MDIPQDPGPESLDFPMDLEPPERPVTPTRLPIFLTSSPDPLGDPGPATRHVQFDPEPIAIPHGIIPKQPRSTVPHKRSIASRNPTPDIVRQCPAPSPFQFAAGAPTCPAPSTMTEEQCLLKARDLVVQASTLATSTKRKTQLLDLLEVFRDFTESGRVNKHGLSVLASQVSSLETVSRSLGSKVRELHKPSSTTSTTQPQPTPKPPTPAFTSYAATAARAQPTTSDWQQVTRKKTTATPVKNSLNNRQLVLIQESQVHSQQNRPTFDPLALRNAFNLAFTNKGVNGPVVASVTSSKRENIVLTTTPAFTAKYLLEKVDIWQHITQFKEALPIQPWFKVAIHNVPTSFHTNESLSILKEEIPTFNKGLEIVGNPYWLTKEEKRQDQRTGSVCIAFATEQQAQNAIRNRLYLLGISVRVEKLHSTPASTQCHNCQRYGHTEARCSGNITCKLCAEPHHTRLHKCNTCNAKGKACVHTVPVCANCKGAHTADSKLCDTYQATIHHPNQGSNATFPVEW